MKATYSVEGLRASVAKGERPKFLFFWGHSASADGAVTKAFLSQWWPSQFVVEGVTYPTAEHFMMASKARLFGDMASLQRILNSRHPKQAKEFGRQVTRFDERIWNEERFKLVVTGNQAKFAQNPSLQAFLLGTNKKILVEASPYDRIWGIGLSTEDERAEKPAEWRGLNLLGFALMEVRDKIRTA